MAPPASSDAQSPPPSDSGSSGSSGSSLALNGLFVITPLVLGSRLKVSPLILFVWLVFWGALWGIGGAVLAAPMLALIKLACDQNTNWIGVARWLEG